MVSEDDQSRTSEAETRVKICPLGQIERPCGKQTKTGPLLQMFSLRAKKAYIKRYSGSKAIESLDRPWQFSFQAAEVIETS